MQNKMKQFKAGNTRSQPGIEDFTADDFRQLAAGGRVGFKLVGDTWIKTQMPGSGTHRTAPAHKAEMDAIYHRHFSGGEIVGKVSTPADDAYNAAKLRAEIAENNRKLDAARRRGY